MNFAKLIMCIHLPYMYVLFSRESNFADLLKKRFCGYKFHRLPISSGHSLYPPYNSWFLLSQNLLVSLKKKGPTYMIIILAKM